MIETASGDYVAGCLCAAVHSAHLDMNMYHVLFILIFTFYHSYFTILLILRHGQGLLCANMFQDNSMIKHIVSGKIFNKLENCFFVGGSIGDCTTDSFAVSSPGNKGTPVICGFYSGQHSKIYI